jgi:hypothetical protein
VQLDFLSPAAGATAFASGKVGEGPAAQRIVSSDEVWVAQVAPPDVQAEQELADAFQQAGQISKAVDIAGISQDVLAAGYNSMDA